MGRSGGSQKRKLSSKSSMTRGAVRNKKKTDSMIEHALFSSVSNIWEEQFELAQDFQEEDRKERRQRFRRRALTALGVIAATAAASVLLNPAWSILALALVGKAGLGYSREIKSYINADIIDPLPEDVAPWIGARITETSLEKERVEKGQMSALETISHLTGASGIIERLRRKKETRSGNGVEVTRDGEIINYDYEKRNFIIRWDSGEEGLVSPYELFAEGGIPYDRIPKSLLSGAEKKRIGNHIARAKQLTEGDESTVDSKVEELMDELDLHYQIEQTEAGRMLEEEVRGVRLGRGENVDRESYQLHQEKSATLWQQIYRLLSS